MAHRVHGLVDTKQLELDQASLEFFQQLAVARIKQQDEKRLGIPINHKKVYRLMKENQL